MTGKEKLMLYALHEIKKNEDEIEKLEGCKNSVLKVSGEPHELVDEKTPAILHLWEEDQQVLIQRRKDTLVNLRVQLDDLMVNG